MRAFVAAFLIASLMGVPSSWAQSQLGSDPICPKPAPAGTNSTVSSIVSGNPALIVPRAGVGQGAAEPNSVLEERRRLEASQRAIEERVRQSPGDSTQTQVTPNANAIQPQQMRNRPLPDLVQRRNCPPANQQ